MNCMHAFLRLENLQQKLTDCSDDVNLKQDCDAALDNVKGHKSRIISIKTCH